MQWLSKVLEGVKKHCSGSDVNGYGKERAEARDLAGRGSACLDGVDSMGFVGTKGEGLDVC